MKTYDRHRRRLTTTPRYLARRHMIDGCQPVLGKVQNALINFARVAAQP